MFGTGLIRKATKAVVYTAIPVSGPLKAATMGTRKGNLNRKEMRKQTELLERQNALLAAPAARPRVGPTPTTVYKGTPMWWDEDGWHEGTPPQVAPAAPVISPDGRFWWDGSVWRPLPTAAP